MGALLSSYLLSRSSKNNKELGSAGLRAWPSSPTYTPHLQLRVVQPDGFLLSRVCRLPQVDRISCDDIVRLYSWTKSKIMKDYFFEILHTKKRSSLDQYFVHFFR